MKLINEDYFTKHTQTLLLFTIDIKQKLFTKVIKNAKLEGFGWEI